jgi:SAM-dependent methyltransferase
VVCPVVEVDLPRGSFDVVTMQSYIEHESNPMAALRAAWDLLKPGGVLVVKTPNHDCWNRRLRRSAWCGYRFPDHCNYFTMRTLSAAALRAGFRILPGLRRDRLAFSDNMYLAVEKPAVEKVNSAERCGQRNRYAAELSQLYC